MTLTQVLPSTGTGTDNWLLTLSGNNYNVGLTTPKGNINLATAGALKTSGSVVNTNTPDASFTNTPARAAALPGVTGVSLGTRRFTRPRWARILTATGMAIAAPAVKVLNVVNYAARMGGATVEAELDEPGPPLAHRDGGTSQPGGNRLVVHPVRARQHDP